MLTELLIGIGLVELGASVLVLLALLLTCAVLWDAHPPHGPRR